jgi:hypothetical protein
VECVYIGGNKIAITGMAMQGTNWMRAYGRRSSKNLPKIFPVLYSLTMQNKNV